MDNLNQNQTIISILLNLVQAVYTLNTTVSTVFPQGQSVTASAGAASGNYLTVIATDGNTYKIELLDVA